MELNGSSNGSWNGSAPLGGGEKVALYSVAVPTLISLCGLSTVGNVYILASTRWLRRAPSPTLLLTISLCAADAWVPLHRHLFLPTSPGCLALKMTFLMGTSLILQSWLPMVARLSLPKGVCIGLGYEVSAPSPPPLCIAAQWGSGVGRA